MQFYCLCLLELLLDLTKKFWGHLLCCIILPKHMDCDISTRLSYTVLMPNNKQPPLVTQTYNTLSKLESGKAVIPIRHHSLDEGAHNKQVLFCEVIVIFWP